MIFRCKTHANDFLPNEIRKDLTQYKFVFNPSFVICNDTEYWAFRCYLERQKEILCIIYIFNKTSRELKIIDLNSLFKVKYNVRPADPKLLLLNNKVYCTLNSGHISDGENDVFLFRIDSEMLDIKKCIISNRNRIEKNWSFFEQDREIGMLYAVTPICKVYSCYKEDEEAIYFTLKKEIDTTLPEYSIGTQLQVKGSEGFLIAHKKIVLKGKRIYLGVPLKIDFETLTVIVGSYKMIHSFRAILGSKFKFNRNLMSCTYFSGLQINFERNNAKITYGINDVAWGSSIVKIDKLWR